jgi:predicted alpha/beta hydrolase family esterase
MTRVLILHGLDGSGPDHWQRWLQQQLERAGHDVVFPDLPNASDPKKDEWLAALEPLRGREDTVVCHSLACCLWLHHRSRGGAQAKRTLLVAPPCRDDVPEIADFFPVPVEPGLVPEAELWVSDNDPYCPSGGVSTFAVPLRIAYDVSEGMGHLNPDVGLGPWPRVLDWVLQGAKNGVET